MRCLNITKKTTSQKVSYFDCTQESEAICSLKKSIHFCFLFPIESALLPMLLIVSTIIGAVVVIVSTTIIVLLCMERKAKRFDERNSDSESPPPDKIAQFAPPAKAFII